VAQRLFVALVEGVAATAVDREEIAGEQAAIALQPLRPPLFRMQAEPMHFGAQLVAFGGTSVELRC